MKRFFFILLAFMAVVRLNAQHMPLLPEKGDVGIEISIRPFSGNAIVNLVDDGVKLRFFLTNNDALRLQTGFNWARTSDSSYDHKAGYGSYDFIFGYERHWNVSNRVGLYVGAQAGYLKDFAYYKSPVTTFINTDHSGHIGSNHLMAGFFTGIDVYLWKGLYCGAEIGMKWNMVKECAEKEKTNGGTTTGPIPTLTNMSIGFYCEPAIRLGWTF